MIVFVVGLQDIPQSLYEAARVDGASAWSRLRHITLPMLGNTTGFVLVVATIAALQAFDQIYVLTNGGPFRTTQTVVMQIYQSGFRDSSSASPPRSRMYCWWRPCCQPAAVRPVQPPSEGWRVGLTCRAPRCPSARASSAGLASFVRGAPHSDLLADAVLLRSRSSSLPRSSRLRGQRVSADSASEGQWTLDNLFRIFEDLPFARLILNSFVFAGGVTLFSLAVRLAGRLRAGQGSTSAGTASCSSRSSPA